ncbi:hypothetical protein B0H67DRAFT_686670 [Lasiosphaeris hirsuta]|uniref:Uncharacterized protein n=1 Tax=Lasiosphaeris hirsuta TaxID=260670 RepID=A0AA40A3J7_9PEZI|nr:hypothetical protein B0H67DRAFT_686670 [Lasiosphaeris hirsuta]
MTLHLDTSIPTRAGEVLCPSKGMEPRMARKDPHRGSGSEGFWSVGAPSERECQTPGDNTLRSLKRGGGAYNHTRKQAHAQTKLQVLNFFSKQPVAGTDVYLFRQILQGLVPALKPNVRVIINDHVLPKPSVLSRFNERNNGQFDFTIWLLFNGKE